MYGAAPGWGYAQPAIFEPVCVVGNELEIPVRNAALPHVCAKCGVAHDLRGRFELFKWVHPATYLTLLLGVLPAALLISFSAKQVHAVVPLCGACDRRWTWARRWWALTLTAPIFLLVGGVIGWNVMGSPQGPLELLAYAPFVASLFVIPLVLFFLVRPRTMWAARIDDRRARIRGASQIMLQAVPR